MLGCLFSNGILNLKEVYILEIKLTRPIPTISKSLGECMMDRRSIRKFSNKKINIDTISLLLWAAQGKTFHSRTVPSAGATYPLEIYVHLKNKGLFYLDYQNNILIRTIERDIGRQLTGASLGQAFINDATMVMIICADFSRTCNRYGERGIRYVFIEVGHCAQNVHLACVALGLGSVPIGAFRDRELKVLLQLEERVDPLYLIPISYRK